MVISRLRLNRYLSKSYQKKIARATSTFFIGLDLGLGFGPYILGLFTNQIGLGNMYIVMAVLLIVTFFIYHFIHGRKVSVSKA